MNSKIKKVRDALKKVSDNVYHYECMKKPDQYIVWAEDSEGSSANGDNQKLNQSIQGTIDYFTKTEFDENVDRIQDALNAERISFYLNSVQDESGDDSGSGYIHYEWIFEVT